LTSTTFEFASASSVDHPQHYSAHPSGIECIEIAEHMNFCRGNVVKYIWRASEKGSELEDLKKARWYLDREIARLESRLETRAHADPDDGPDNI
jgi:hypothetical protein